MPRKASAPVFEEKLRDAEVKDGGTAMLECVVFGEPEPDIDWYFEGKLIKDKGRFMYIFEKNDVIGLEIDKCTVDDEGMYECVASNKSGKASSKCELLVNAPKKVSATINVAKQPSKPKPFVGLGKKNKKNKLPVQREGLIAENPEKYYEFGDEIGRGKFSVVRKCKKIDTGEEFAAKMIKFDTDTLKFAIREYDLMVGGRMDNKGLVKLKEAYLVRKYLILILEYAAGHTLLTYMSKKHSLTEEDVAQVVRQLCEILADLHSKNVIHLDIRPTNIRFAAIGSRELKLLDFNSARHIANKQAGEVVDVIGDTEFCAPELLAFDPVLPGSDMWSVAVIMYILLSGISPFFDADEDEVLRRVQCVEWEFDSDSFARVTSEAKDFIKKCFIRIPEMRLTAQEALKHAWLSPDFMRARKNSTLRVQKMKETDKRLYSEEEEEYIEASLVLRTFDEEEYESPEESEEESD